ncbi:hypothetical protein DSO57_1007510 [Entomophthora muscae]|uniref:Uncharacterized protein n=1 Tax=Entomophthora muscae TaxID=34485 RepID=A0ACC2UH91_9FUNG|nr:hypothetical protein DSO57_1007510 [Entomophthora muscae]
MNPRRTSSKPRPVARVDWEEQADAAIRSLWSPKSEAKGDDKYFHKRMASLPVSPNQRRGAGQSAFATAIRNFSKPFASTSQTNLKHANSRAASLPNKVQPTTSQQGLFNDDASLKHARRRIRLARDFDEMLRKGFPTLSLNKADPEFTLYISLTPKVASHSRNAAPKV